MWFVVVQCNPNLLVCEHNSNHMRTLYLFVDFYLIFFGLHSYIILLDITSTSTHVKYLDAFALAAHQVLAANFYHINIMICYALNILVLQEFSKTMPEG